MIIDTIFQLRKREDRERRGGMPIHTNTHYELVHLSTIIVKSYFIAIYGN